MPSSIVTTFSKHLQIVKFLMGLHAIGGFKIEYSKSLIIPSTSNRTCCEILEGTKKTCCGISEGTKKVLPIMIFLNT